MTSIAWSEILGEERGFCEQQQEQEKLRHVVVEIVCVSLSSASMDDHDDDDDSIAYSDATAVSSVTLASALLDEEDIVTLVGTTKSSATGTTEASIEKRTVASPSRQNLAAGDQLWFSDHATSMIVQKLTSSGECFDDNDAEESVAVLPTAVTARIWNARGDACADKCLYLEAKLAYQHAVCTANGLGLAKAYIGLGQVHFELGDIAMAIEYRNLAKDALIAANDTTERTRSCSPSSIHSDELSQCSFADSDELSELFRKATTID